MTRFDEHDWTLHRIKVWLEPRRVKYGAGAFVARAETEQTVLSVENVCAAAVQRGGMRHGYDDMVFMVNRYFEEMVYQIADGFAVGNRFFTIHPVVKGTVAHADGPLPMRTDASGEALNTLGLSFRVRRSFGRLLGRLSLHCMGLAPSGAQIYEVTDMMSGRTDGVVSPGGLLRIDGAKLFVQGPPGEVGVFLVHHSDGAVLPVDAVAVNKPKRLLVLLPAVIPAGDWTLRVVTRFCGSYKPMAVSRTVDWAGRLRRLAVEPVVV